MVLGVFSGVSMLFLPRWLRYVLLYAALLTFFVPGYIYASAWIDLVSLVPGVDTTQLFSIPGAIIVLSLIHFPVTTCATYTACMHIEQEKLEVARMEGSVVALYRHVVLPHATPFVATGGLIVFLLNLGTYTIPSFFQVNTYSIEIFTLYNAFHNPASGLQLALPLMGCALGAILLWWVVIGRQLSQTSYHSPKVVLLKSGALSRGVIILLMGILFLFSIGLPLIMVVLGEVSFTYIGTVWEQSQHEWLSSLSLAFGTTLGIVLISSIGTYCLDGWPRSISFGIVLLLCIPFLISGPAWGIGVIQFWNHAGWRGTIYDQAIIVFMTCVGKYLFVAWIGLTFALRSIRKEYDDAARVFGVSRLRQYWSIILPLTLPYSLVLGVVIFLMVLGDVDSVLLVSPPGYTTIPVRVYNLMHYGSSAMVSSMALLMVMVVGGVLATVSVLIACLTRGRRQMEDS